MKVYKNCSAAWFWAGQGADLDVPCEVRIGDKQIVLDIPVDGGHNIYVGLEDGAGHYRLKCEMVQGHGTLHCFADGDTLEGFWSEGGTYGMWRIQLIDEDD